MTNLDVTGMKPIQYGSASDVTKFMLDALDLISFGYAKRAIAGKLLDKYDVDYAVAVDAIERLTKEVNKLGAELDSINDLKSMVRERAFGANPMGVTYHRLSKAMGSPNQIYETKKAKYTQATNELASAQRDAEDLSNRRSRSLGDLAFHDLSGDSFKPKFKTQTTSRGE